MGSYLSNFISATDHCVLPLHRTIMHSAWVHGSRTSCVPASFSQVLRRRWLQFMLVHGPAMRACIGQSEKMVCFRFPAGWIFTEIHPVGNCVFFFSFLFFRAEFWVSTARNRNKYDISRKWKAISIQNLCLDSFWVVKLYFLCNTFT